ncbi:hypothetical protein KKB43_05275 [Patescibacteria group bacterium]|nr:hypothetical protein [Patescibacteria group bacterium]MBU4580397.1 hypothetical protein [Patescibacteria group bacterium]
MKGNGIKSIAVFGLLIVAMFAMVTPAEARYDLKVSGDNLATLQSLTYGSAGANAWYAYGYGNLPRLLKYDFGITLNYHGRSKAMVTIGSMKAISVGTGECVAFANSLTMKYTVSSSNWKRGVRVMDGGVAPGTLIATFVDANTYGGHVAVFDSYSLLQGPNIGNRIAGFRVWDQNFVASRVAGMHTLWREGSGTINANNYYVVQLD